MGITLDPNSPILGSDLRGRFQPFDWEENSDRISISDVSSPSCVGIIDIIDSTRITARLNKHQMSKFYCHFINWANAVVRGYGGIVVKNTGDGLLFYFPLAEDSVDTRRIEDCLNCSIALCMLHPNINSKFRSESLPPLNYRISLDYGEVSFANTKETLMADIFSVTVNVCAKINIMAEPNSVVIGGDMYQVAKSLGGYSFKEVKKSISIANRLYPVYSVNESRTVLQYLRSIRHPHPPTNQSELNNGLKEVKLA